MMQRLLAALVLDDLVNYREVIFHWDLKSGTFSARNIWKVPTWLTTGIMKDLMILLAKLWKN